MARTMKDLLSYADVARRTREVVNDFTRHGLSAGDNEEIVAALSIEHDKIREALAQNTEQYRKALASHRSLRDQIWLAFLSAIIGGGVVFLLFRGGFLPGSQDLSWLAVPSAVAYFVALLVAGQLRQRKAATLPREVFENAVTREIRLRVNLAATRLEAPEKRWSNTFALIKAPSLVELNVTDAAPSSTLETIKSFVEEHDATAIGIAGPRGAGKSTLVRQVRDAAEVGVEVSVPIGYEVNELTRMIHRQLARRIGGRSLAQVSTRRRHAFARFLPVIAGIMVAAGALAAFVADRATVTGKNSKILDRVNPYDDEFDPTGLFGVRLGWMGIAALVLFGIAAGYLLLRTFQAAQNFQAGARLTDDAVDLPSLGTNALTFLDWTTTVERTAKGTAAAGKNLTVEGTDKLARAQRELTHAESVQELRLFLEKLVTLLKRQPAKAELPGRVVVCIDELDKVDKPETAINMINGLKDLFHVDGVHFLVSVSTDALARFAARGVPVRDAFDSSFDTIVRMTPLTAEESRTLIFRRALRFRSSAALFCLAWSGGNARDLIRTARACVVGRGNGETDRALGDLASGVIRDQLTEIIDAMTSDALKDVDEAALTALLDLRDRLGDRGTTIEEARLAHDPGGGLTFRETDWSSEIVPAAAFTFLLEVAALTEALFAVERTPEQWSGRPMENAATALARARASLGRHPVEVRRLIGAARAACDAAPRTVLAATP
ncbi:P-loop NTPase fold protein [Actinoplanes sp. NPDC026619]|uniref:P-loop NTPase fold protein n=1 Tax=Actinoplanes sp. NPDC026619 TaxID=3155798 RepID=UPI0033DB6653